MREKEREREREGLVAALERKRRSAFRCLNTEIITLRIFNKVRGTNTLGDTHGSTKGRNLDQFTFGIIFRAMCLTWSGALIKNLVLGTACLATECCCNKQKS